jgi:HPt (histidine-containing phosphotransfer) domain-containing protein
MSDPQPGVMPAEPTPEGVTPSPEPTDGRDALIEKLRKFEREAQPQLKELERLRAAQEKAKREALSEAERISADLSAATAERDRLATEHASLGERHTALAAQVEKLVKAQLAELPEQIRELAPSGDDLAARLEWIAKAKKAAAPTSPGTPSGPRGTGAQALVQPNQADLLAQKRRQIGSL